MPISTRSKSSMKPVSTWNADEQQLRSTIAAAETLMMLRSSLRSATPAPTPTPRRHRSSANYAPGTFTGMDE